MKGNLTQNRLQERGNHQHNVKPTNRYGAKR